MTVKDLWVDDSNECGLTILMSVVDDSSADAVILCKHLTGCPEAIMAHDTCHSLIGFYLGSKHRFVFRALSL